LDTKWKKGKVICSFMVFAIGVTMLIVNLVPALGIFLALEGRVFQQQVDYQESWEFRNLISGRLEELLGVATGGKSWGNDETGVSPTTDYGCYEGSAEGFGGWLGRAFNEVTVTEDAVTEQSASESAPDDYWEAQEDWLRHQDEVYEAYVNQLIEMGMDADGEALDRYFNSYDYDNGYGYAYTYASGWTLDEYMAEMAHNKNIRYAIVYQDKLLYTNIEDYEGQTGEAWNGTDFYDVLSREAYNFTLWYNRQGDGKVQIVKDGLEVDVYGDGIYGDDSLWRVPGYANYTLGESAKDAVIFLAAAKEPQLYLVGDYSGYGLDQYGGRLYRMRQSVVVLNREFEKRCSYLIASAILIIFGVLLHKSKRVADQKIADILGKICLEIKIPLCLFIFLFLVGKSAGVLTAMVWKISNGGSYYCSWSGDIAYEIARMMKAGGYLAAFYWFFYLVFLDWKGNRQKQKKPLIRMLRTKDFKYPLQKRLVRRQRIAVIIEVIILMIAGIFLSVLCLLYGMTADYLGYESWEWVEWGYGWTLGGELYGLGMLVLIFVVIVLGVPAAFMAVDICMLRRNRKLAEDIGALSDQIQAVREGNLTEDLHMEGDTDLQEAARNLNEIQKGMETALREQMKSERMKVDLVTNVSHDIKTPLTSIVSYVELLRQEQDLPEHVKEFIQILGEKSERLRNIVQDVFEISKATSGQLPVKMEILDMGKLLRQTLADMNVQIAQSSFTMKFTIPETPMPVMADGQRLYRVFQNLLQNALRYSLEGSRIFLTLTEEAGQIVVRMKNTSSVELTDTKDFTERFVRGDESRTDGGSGLGLSIAKSFTQACGGSLVVETDADLFTVTVSFQKAESVVLAEEEELS